MKPRRVQQTAANSGGCFFFGIPLLRRPTSTASYFFPLHIIFCGLLLALSSSSSFFTHAEKQTAKRKERLEEASRDPCAFPHFTERSLCAFNSEGESQLLGKWVCDPENTISMSEIYSIDDTVRQIYGQNEYNCQCPQATTLGKTPTCWYKFAFAFLRELRPDFELLRRRAEDGGGWNCARTNGTLRLDPPLPVLQDGDGKDGLEVEEDMDHLDDDERRDQMLGDSVMAYAENYARVLLDQWGVGGCGEEVLLFVVQRRPKELWDNSMNTLSLQPFSRPMIVASFGPRVHERFDLAASKQTSIEHLRRAVDDANEQLRNGYPLAKALNDVIKKSAGSLERVERSLRRSHTPRSHIPVWAWIVFGVCALLFALMSVGLFLIRQKNTRRNNNIGNNKANSVANFQARRWKTIANNDEQQQYSPTAYTNTPTKHTNVNLVQMLFPHTKPPPINMPQQV